MNTALAMLMVALSFLYARSDDCRWIDTLDRSGIKDKASVLDDTRESSQDACKSRCLSTKGCFAVDWLYGNCRLFNAVPFLEVAIGSVHSVLDCPKEGCTLLKRRCIPGATCNNVTRQCVCPEDEPKGDATIECVPQDKHMCMVTCDPKVKTYDGEKVSVNLPCWYRVTDVLVKGYNLRFQHDACRIQVFALNQLTDRGLFFVGTTIVQLGLGRRELSGAYSWPSFSTRTIVLDGESIREAIRSNTPNHLFDRRPVQYLLDLSIETRIDRVGHYAVVNFRQCWARLKFRPFDPNSQPQVYKPGVTVTVPRRAQFPPSADRQMNAVCLRPGIGPSVYSDRSDYLGLAHKDELILANIFRMGGSVQNINLEHEYKRHCKAVVAEFTNKDCEPFRSLAIRLCVPILNERRVIRCLQKGQVNVMDVFLSCIRWACTGDKLQCGDYLTSLKTSQCALTKLMKQIDCDPLRRLESDNLFHKGPLVFQNR